MNKNKPTQMSGFIFGGVERTTNFYYPLNTIRYWISFVWVSISKFKTTPQIRVRCIYSNQIEFWVLIYFKFNATGLMVLIEVLFTVPITIEDWSDLTEKFNFNLHRIIWFFYGEWIDVYILSPRDGFSPVSPFKWW